MLQSPAGCLWYHVGAGLAFAFSPVPGSEAMQHAPWSFVPTVLVPIWLILHAIIAVQLRHAKLGRAVMAAA
jgi:hypothetical protein